MKKESIWLDNINFDKLDKLNKNEDIDVLIIGGGITGLSTAYHLMNSNLKICVVERNKILHGVTSRTTGKLTYLQENIYTKLKDKANIYYKSQKEAIDIIKSIIDNNSIECDLEKTKSYIFASYDKDISKVKKEQLFLDKIGIKYNKEKRIPFNIRCKYALSVDDTYVFHPIKYLMKIKDILIDNGISIYENSNVTSIRKEKDKFICDVNNYIIKTKKVVVASHYPFFLLPYLFPLRTYLEKSYISASLIGEAKNFNAITVTKPTESLRFHNTKDNNYFIYLTGSHNLCTKYNDINNYNLLLNKTYKLGLKPDFIWSNYDVMTEDNLPYIGYIDDNLLIGTGYNTWGMTNGSLAGKIISDLILNKRNKYICLFDPKRNKKFINKLKYPMYISYSAKSFVTNKIIKNKAWYSNRVKFVRKNNKPLAIYIDDNNKEHIVHNLCPHMKCSLIFNEVEKTWDCPCHGSRFSIDGKCIFGPSNKDIGYKDNG